MQIAQVVPKVRTRSEGIFDYAIPPQLLAELKIGLFVLVPFARRNVEGIVVDIKRSSKIDNLKSIIAIIDSTPVVDQTHIDLAKWMSSYYLTDLSKTLFESIVPPAKRAIKKLSDIKGDDIDIDHIQVKPKNAKNSREYLIMADFAKRLKFYKRAISKTLTQGHQVIILVPDLSLISDFSSIIGGEITELHAGLTLTERWTNWDSIRRNHAKIIIGSNSAVFAPAPNLGLVIIDQEENETYKSDQAPRYNTLKVAQKLGQLTGTDLIIGSATPSYTTYWEARYKKYLYIDKDIAKPDIAIVNMNFEHSILSHPLQEKLDEIIDQNKKAILVLNRKGEGSRLTCSDCGWIYNCPDCGLPLVPNLNNMTCHNCEKDFVLASTCGKCQSTNIKIGGMTTAKVEKLIQKIYPNIKTIRIEKDHPIDINSPWQIAIVTNFALKSITDRVDLVVILDADQSLNFPGFRTQEQSFQTFYKFLMLGKSALIQTHLPESELIRDLASLNYESAFEQETHNRQKFKFPPFTSLIKLVFRDATVEKCQTESKKLAEKLKSIIATNKLDTQILGPSPSFNSRQKKYFYYQIILKFSRRSGPIDEILKKLPKGWTIDVDPFDII